MNKLSDLVNTLNDYIKEHGDRYYRHYKITDDLITQESWINSPTRETKAGGRAKINHKEFVKMIKEREERK